MTVSIRTQPGRSTVRPAGLPALNSGKPAIWIALWGVYALSMLGYLGYQSAWLSTLCIGAR